MEKKITLGFDGGINQSVDCQYLKPNEAAKSENCDLSKGNLSLCKGYSNFSIATHSVEIKTIFNYSNATMYYFNALRGVIIVVDVEGKTYLLNQAINRFILVTDNWMQEAGQTYLADFVNYQSDSIFMTIYTNMHDYVKVIENVVLNGNTLTSNNIRRLKKLGKDSEVSDANVAPRGRYIELYKERLWLCGGDLYNVVWFSKDYDPEDFTTPIAEGEANQHGGFIDIPTWDNGVIVGIKGLFEDVIIFKTNNIYRIYGTSPENFTVSQVSDNFQGTIANNTIKSYSNGIFFTAHDGIYLFDGMSVKNISQKIEDRFIGRPVGQVSTAVATIYKNKYIVAIKGDVPRPPGNNDPLWGSVNNIIIEYDILKQNFMIKTGFEVSDFLFQNDELLFVNRENQILKYNDTYKFNTDLITAFWKTGDLTFGEVDKKKRVQGFYFVAKGTGSIVLSVVTEKKIKTKIVPLTTTFLPYKVKLKNKGKVISFKFENVGGINFTIKQVEVLYSD